MWGVAIAGWIIALLVILLVIVAIVLVAGLVLRARRRRRVRQSDWNTQALDACASAASLHEQLETRLTLAQPTEVDAAAPGDRWSDSERNMDQLATKLQALRFNAPDYTSDQATEQLIMALVALRSALQVQHGARAVSDASAGEPVTVARARLMEFDAATRALRAAI